MSVVRAEEGLDRSVPGLALLDELERREQYLVGERYAELAREGGHLRIRGRAAGHPLPYLPGAVGRLSAVRERRLEEREVHEAER